MSDRKRVAVTGLGAITPIGNTVGEFWAGLIAGKSGVGPTTLFDPSKLGCRIAAEVKGFNPKDHFDGKTANRVERFAQFAMIASRQAWEDSGLKDAGVAPEDIGCYVGAGVGGIGHIQESCGILFEKGADRVSPLMIPRIIPNAAPGHVAIELGLRGPCLAIVTACAAGSNAVGEAAEAIRRGAAKVMLAGGAEAALCLIGVAGFDKMRALCADGNDAPEAASRPFDAKRSGFVPSEGAGMLVLEDYDHAVARGARIYAEMAGYAATCDAHHITAPSPDAEGGARALALAIRDARLAPADVGYINAHGTSTDLNDKLETLAIKRVFGEEGARRVPISSIKSMVGHSLAAAGGIEAVATIMALVEQTLPPTINLHNPDPECDLDYVPNAARKVQGLRAAASNSLGFGGHNAVVVFTRDS